MGKIIFGALTCAMMITGALAPTIAVYAQEGMVQAHDIPLKYTPPQTPKLLTTVQAQPILQFFSKWVKEDIDAASTLSTSVPALQDTVGKACWDTFSNMGAVIAAHPLPLTLKLASDIEAARLFIMAIKQVCQKPECSQVWNDLQNQASAISPVPVVTLGSICAKIP